LEVRASKLEGRVVLSGNHAVALGALVAGCRRYAGYPITPATDIMEILADELPKVGGALVQAEDEIAAIGMVVGASYAGQKSMTATSGPGISLMTEMLGLASMAEIPTVVIDCQRAGPSTGMPTRHEQGDLNLAVYGAHGEVQRVVLAPSSVVDCFWTTIDAFNLAEEFQLPVIVLQDTVLAVRTESIPRPDLSKVNIVNRKAFAYRDTGDGKEPGYDAASGPEHYLRYQITPDGVSPMAIPGTPGGAYVATGLEHTQAANTSSDARNHTAMTEKRFSKLQGAVRKAPPAHEYGDPSAEIGFLTWGSTLGVVSEAIDRLAARGIKAHALAPRMVWPLPTHQIDPFLTNKRRVIVPEVNYTGQFAQLLKTHYQNVEFERVNVYGGQPFNVSQIVESVEKSPATTTNGTLKDAYTEAAVHA
jgi:2-oxoglutarate/2-oxoacid ferredoxin oxidoreductase subunit alpha